MLALSCLPTYEEAILTVSSELGRKACGLPKKGQSPTFWVRDRELVTVQLLRPIQICVPPGPRTGYLCVAGGPGHTEQYHQGQVGGSFGMFWAKEGIPENNMVLLRTFRLSSGSLQRKLTRMSGKGRQKSHSWCRAKSPQSSGRCWVGSPLRSRNMCLMTFGHPSPSYTR